MRNAVNTIGMKIRISHIRKPHAIPTRDEIGVFAGRRHLIRNGKSYHLLAEVFPFKNDVLTVIYVVMTPELISEV